MNGATMVDLVDQNEALLSQDLVQDPIVAYPEPCIVVIPALELGGAVRRDITLAPRALL
jgi:hypothetical protein